MGEAGHTERKDVHLMPWNIRASEGDELSKDCILVAVMHGGEMVSVSLHVAEQNTGE